MSYLMVKNPFLPDSFGSDYDSPRSMTYGFNTAFIRGSPNQFRNAGTGLPKWLNFRTPHVGTQENHHDETVISAKSEDSQKTPQRITRQDSALSNSTRSGKSVNSGHSLRKKVEEHEMKTKTEEWKKNREYKNVRERRNLSKKQTNPKIRLIRRFYVPSIFFILVGVIFIFGSTIHSVGDGTIFWTYKETFKIVGLLTVSTGVIMLLVTVGVESRSSEKWKKKGIPEVDPFLHPDFLKERERLFFHGEILKQTSERSFSVELPTLDYHSVIFNDISQDGEQAFLCSSIQSATSAFSKVNAADGFVLQKMVFQTKTGQVEDTGSFILCRTRSALNLTSTQRSVLEIANETEEESFLCSSVQSVNSVSS